MSHDRMPAALKVPESAVHGELALMRGVLALRLCELPTSAHTAQQAVPSTARAALARCGLDLVRGMHAVLSFLVFEFLRFWFSVLGSGSWFLVLDLRSSLLSSFFVRLSPFAFRLSPFVFHLSSFLLLLHETNQRTFM
eukprot:SAG11_NODE_2100_length_3826_cov_40.900456_5_plen_138_part_00